jgi:DNA polymerase III subunit gamma/tau
MQVRVVSLEPGLLRFAQPPGFTQDIVAQLRDGLAQATGERWQVEHVMAEGAPTLVERDEAANVARIEAVRRSPLVEAAFAAFPEAELIEDDREAAQGGRGNWRR